MIEQSYIRNRQNFCEAARLAGAKLDQISYKRKIVTDIELITDIALLGPEDASQVVIIASGLHGVELPAGSLLQQIWLSQMKQIPDTRFVFVHALNPHGAHFGMRTDWCINGQGNIDPARNFVDFKIATNTVNADIAMAVSEADLSIFGAIRMWAKLLYSAFIIQGKTEFKKGFVRGQYSDPNIPYYGGASPSLSRLTWDEIIGNYVFAKNVKKIWHLDCHTGDGPFGLLQLYINNHEGDHVYKDACQLAPTERIQMTEKYFANVCGDIVDYWSQLRTKNGYEDVLVTPITLEFGTSSAKIEGIDVLNAILTRSILHRKFDDNHPNAPKIIQRMHDAFAPRHPQWRKRVETQAQEIWDRLIRII